METDVKLKVLFRKYAAGLLELTGDAGSEVLSAEVVELQDFKRSVDCLLKLRRGQETYYRHVEFQAEADPDMPERCFRYNTQLVLQYRVPVLTTVVYLFRPGPASRTLSFEVRLANRLVNVWHFDVVCLWEVDAQEALAHGAPGLLALVPLMRGGEDLELIAAADRGIEEAAPGEAGRDAAAILLLLAGWHYTVDELSKAVRRSKMIRSSVWEEALAEGRTKGRAEGLTEGLTEGQAKGRVDAERELCADLVRELHPAISVRVLPAIESCSDPFALKRWALLAAKGTDADLLKELGLG